MFIPVFLAGTMMGVIIGLLLAVMVSSEGLAKILEDIHERLFSDE